MAIDTVTASPSSRRAVLVGAIGALAAGIAGVLGRPGPVRADNNGSILLGNSPDGTPDGTGINEASASTAIRTTAGWGLLAESTAAYGAGLYGFGSNASAGARGVYAHSNGATGTGVHGYAAATSGANRGVYGESNSPDGVGVFGMANGLTGATRGVYGRVSSPDGTAVQGYSGSNVDPDPVPVAKTGVYGYAAQDSGARGVYGRSTSGRGVFGSATSGQGVRGYATSSTGTALYASTPVSGSTGLHTGTALLADGRVKFPNCVGIATIGNGLSATSAISPGIDLTSTSVVTATLMGSAGGTVTVHRVAVNATANTFTIFLTGPVTTTSVKVGWHVFG